MHPYFMTILCAAGLVLLFALVLIRENYKRKKMMLGKIRRIYGTVPEREYETGDIERISHYFQRKENMNFVIDDITWNDLDMDHIYMMVNQTVSSPGEDVLYDMMRRPLFSQEELDERERQIAFFAENAHKREQLQLILSKVGKSRLGSLADTVFSLKNAPKASLGIHVIMIIAILCALVSLLFFPLQGFLACICLSMANMTIYYASADRKIMEIYLDCFSSLLRILQAADEMDTVDWPEIKKQMDSIKEGKREFRVLRKKAVFLTSTGKGFDNILQAFMDYVRMVLHVDILTYNSVLKEAKDKADVIMSLIENIGELDALISIASFRELLVLKAKPEFVPYTGKAISLKVEDLYHPLIPEAVANSITASGGTLVTGSNASGKSTFLKNMAINSILAQTIHTCTCSRYRAPFLKVMTSMALRDDLSGGDSYFIVEIKSLKRILEESRKEEPLLCIIDEVLRGTNTIERIAASSRILNRLAENWVLPFAATHDIELSYILDDVYENYHFEEEIKDNQVIFNYLLQKGRAITRNAIRLLDMLGYDSNVVCGAQEAAQDFEKTGTWKKIKRERSRC